MEMVQKIQNLTPYNGVVYRRREEDPGSGDVKKWKSDHAFFSEKVEKEIVFHRGLLIMIQTSYNSYVVLRNESNGRQIMRKEVDPNNVWAGYSSCHSRDLG
ncbi:hypothetical protein OIU84_001267 [Salix udensis]|uniref:Uncharacterized protein n=1 Tax=Salix udensis TaxID=889485 RepID=A0AAD6K6F7_9ROSI|nr:hypothetical protein OIU84_001267 [Salix udensis]